MKFITALLTLLPPAILADKFIDVNSDAFGLLDIPQTTLISSESLRFRFYPSHPPSSVIRSTFSAPCQPFVLGSDAADNSAGIMVNSGVVTNGSEFIVKVADIGATEEPVIFYNGEGNGACREGFFIVVGAKEGKNWTTVRQTVNENTVVVPVAGAGPVIGGTFGEL